MSIFVAPRPAAKAMTGIGAAAMTTQPMAPWVSTSYLGREQKYMKQCTAYWKSDPWIRAAEKTIAGLASTTPWHLEDANDQNVDDLYPNKAYLIPRDLLEKPQAMLAIEDRQPQANTWRKLSSLTVRHMGVTGNAFWYLDGLESQGRTPNAILYIPPWRMWPIPDKAGNLTGWMLDWNEDSHTGTRLELDEVLHFTLEPPEEGFFGIGLVESALGLVSLDKAAVSHANATLGSGGRLAGIVSAKDAANPIPDDKFQQIVRDMRSVAELPDAAKRTVILQGAIDFTQTAANMQELGLNELLTLSRDFILQLWGVPLSQLGGATSVGLNAGDKGKNEEAAMWKGAIDPRLDSLRETIQLDLLDRYQALGITVELEFEEPSFDDEAPKYELAVSALSQPLRNWERREIIGKEPFGDPAWDNAVWMPNNMVEAFMAPDENGTIVPSKVPPPPEPPPNPFLPAPLPALPPGAKADLPPKVARLHGNLSAHRSKVDREYTPAVKAALVSFLDRQKADVASRLRMNGKPNDVDGWFTKARWDRELLALLERPLTAMAQGVQLHVEAVVPSKAPPAGTVERALARGAARVSAINERTRAAIKAFVVDALKEGLSPAELADRIEAGVLLDNGQPAFDELRAETIARTELMDAYNGAALGSYRDAGLSEVQAIDGDQDEECAERDGRIFSIAEANDIMDHPNGTLDWVPVIEFPQAKALNERQMKALELVESMTREAGQSDERLATVIAGFNSRAEAEAQRPIIVHSPVVNVPPTTVNVEVPAPIVNVPAPIVQVPPQRLVRTVVDRDEAGNAIGTRQEFE